MISTLRPRLTRFCATFNEHPQVICTPLLASLSLTMTEDFFKVSARLLVAVVQAVVHQVAVQVAEWAEAEESLYLLQLESR